MSHSNDHIKRLNRFFTEEDFLYQEKLAREYYQTDINMVVILHRVDKNKSYRDDLYGEALSHEIQFLEPVELNVLLKIDESEPRAYNRSEGTFRYVDFGNLTFDVLVAELKEKDCDIEYGDYIEYRADEEKNYYYEVTNDGRIGIDTKHSVAGYRQLYRTIKAVHSQRKDVFL